MKIISDFRDYYDTACGHGIDPTLKFVRKTYQEEVHLKRTGSTSYNSELAENLRVAIGMFNDMPKDVCAFIPENKLGSVPWSSALIGFCGHLYPCLEVNGKWFYDSGAFIDAAVEFMNKYDKHYNVERFIKSTAEKVNKKYPWKNDVFSKDRWKAVVERCKQPFHDLFVKVGSPVFSIEREPYRAIYTITINPKLNHYTFYTVFPANVAFQNISMYLENELATQIDPTDTTSDDVKIHKHGFDKTSFRKQSTKKG